MITIQDNSIRREKVSICWSPDMTQSRSGEKRIILGAGPTF